MQSALYFEIVLLKYIYVVYWLVVVGFGAWFFDATAFKVKAIAKSVMKTAAWRL